MRREIGACSSASLRHQRARAGVAQELHLLPQPPPDHRVVAVEPERQRLAVVDLLPDEVLDEPGQLRLASAAAARRASNCPASRSSCAGVTSMTRRSVAASRGPANRYATKTASPMRRKCSSGSRSRRPNNPRSEIMANSAPEGRLRTLHRRHDVSPAWRKVRSWPRRRKRPLNARKWALYSSHSVQPSKVARMTNHRTHHRCRAERRTTAYRRVVGPAAPRRTAAVRPSRHPTDGETECDRGRSGSGGSRKARGMIEARGEPWICYPAGGRRRRSWRGRHAASAQRAGKCRRGATGRHKLRRRDPVEPAAHAPAGAKSAARSSCVRLRGPCAGPSNSASARACFFA